MKAETFTHVVAWGIAHGYALFFVAAFFDGPIVTTAAGAAAALGYFNIWIIVIIAIVADLLADTWWYFLGYYGRGAFIDNYGHYVGLTPKRIIAIEAVLKKHSGKALVFIKLSPIIPVPGIITLGIARTSYKRFIIISTLITIPKSMIFALIGFYSGKTYVHVTNTVGKGGYVVLGLVIIIGIIYIAYRRAAKMLSQGSGIEEDI